MSTASKLTGEWVNESIRYDPVISSCITKVFIVPEVSQSACKPNPGTDWQPYRGGKGKVRDRDNSGDLVGLQSQ